jgi:hypothetical protein
MHKDYPDIDARLLVKLHRGKNELTRSEKIFNKNPCRVRIRIENSLADVKKFQVLSQPYRHSLHYYNPPCENPHYGKVLSLNVLFCKRSLVVHPSHQKS